MSHRILRGALAVCLLAGVAAAATSAGAAGRYKKEGNRCEWNSNDSGPNQCDPREVRK